jgi:putrescine transport system ATP-binding protein
VADFIGDVNIFDGKVTASNAGSLEIAIDSDLTIRVSGAEPLPVGSAAGFAIRPEKLRVSRTPPANPGINAASGELWDIAYLGDMTVFHVKLKSGAVVKASSLNAQRSVEDPFVYDQEVWVTFAEDAGVVLKD